MFVAIAVIVKIPHKALNYKIFLILTQILLTRYSTNHTYPEVLIYLLVDTILRK